MGVVLRARDTADGSQVAIKLLLQGAQANARQRRRFEREVRTLLRLKHPNVVQVVDAGQDAQGNPWLAMELVDSGVPLNVRVDEGSLRVRESIRIVRALAGAVEACHAQGVLHRDIKPENVLLRGDGTPVLTDFGLAKDLEVSLHASQLTAEGSFLGSPGYLAPEQARGELDKIGPTADVYGLGATFYAMLTGEAPYDGDTLIEVLGAMHQPAEPPSRSAPGIDPTLDRIVLRCLEVTPEERFQSAAELDDALDRYSQGERDSPETRLAKPLLVAALVSLGVVLGLAGYVAATSGDPAPAVGEASAPPSAVVPEPPSVDSGPQPQAKPVEPAPPPAPDPEVERERALLELRELGLAAHAAGDEEHAVELLSEYLARRPDDTWALVGRGESLANLQRLEPAVADLSRALLLGPDEPAVAYVNRAMCYRILERFDEAEADLTVLIESLPEHPFYLFLRGRNRVERGAAREGYPDLLRSVELNPTLAEAWFWLARACEELEDLPAAQSAYGTYVQLEPDDPKGFFRLGGVLCDQDDLEGAEAAYTRTLELSPNDAGVWYNRALVRGDLGNKEGAVADYGAGLELRPDHLDSLINRGELRRMLDDFSGAIADLTRAAELAPDDPRAVVGRAQAYQAAEEWAAAEADWTRGIELGLDPPAVYSNRARCRKNAGDVDGAVADLELLLTRVPDDHRLAVRARERIAALRAPAR